MINERFEEYEESIRIDRPEVTELDLAVVKRFFMTGALAVLKCFSENLNPQNITPKDVKFVIQTIHEEIGEYTGFASQT